MLLLALPGISTYSIQIQCAPVARNSARFSSFGNGIKLAMAPIDGEEEEEEGNMAAIACNSGVSTNLDVGDELTGFHRRHALNLLLLLKSES